VTFNTNADLQAFCAATNIDRNQLQEWGRTVRTRGYSYDITQKLCDPGNGKTGWILRRIRRDWRIVDGTMPQTEEDFKKRYTKVTSQGREITNTCALDATIFCSIRLDAGRTRIDQLPMDVMSALGPVPTCMRNIVSKYWGTETLDTRNTMRDELLRTLVKHNPAMHAAGRLQDVKTVIESCFSGLAQLSFTTIRADVCCDDIPYIRPGSTLIRRHFLEVPLKLLREGHSLAVALHHLFQATGKASIPDAARSLCSRGDLCRVEPKQAWVVMDRMPPILVVGLQQPVTLELEKTYRVFEVQEFGVQGPDEHYPVRYKPIGCIMKHGDEHHFTARWCADRSDEDAKGIMYYDGAESDQAKFAETWWSPSPFRPTTRSNISRRSLGPAVMFYERIRACKCRTPEHACGGPPYSLNH
jgi:hypothetical protein